MRLAVLLFAITPALVTAQARPPRFQTIPQVGVHLGERSSMMAGFGIEVGVSDGWRANLGLMVGGGQGIIELGVNAVIDEIRETTLFAGVGIATYELVIPVAALRAGLEHRLSSDVAIRMEARLYSAAYNPALILGLAFPPLLRD